jgi:hypothetical protein
MNHRANTANVFNGLQRGKRRLTEACNGDKSSDRILKATVSSYVDVNPMDTCEGT